jgi:protein-tyrosine-phosphatase
LKLKVLFVCPTNGLHSPMAEVLLRRIDGEHFEAMSAGASCERLHPLAVEVMKEIGIDLGLPVPRTVQELENDDFDYVITLGERATEHCRNFTRAEMIHWKLNDLVAMPNDPEKQLRAFRLVRDQIAQRLNLFVLVLTRPASFRPALSKAQAAR